MFKSVVTDFFILYTGPGLRMSCLELHACTSTETMCTVEAHEAFLRCSSGWSMVNAAAARKALDWRPALAMQRREGWGIRVSTSLAADQHPHTHTHLSPTVHRWLVHFSLAHLISLNRAQVVYRKHTYIHTYIQHKNVQIIIQIKTIHADLIFSIEVITCPYNEVNGDQGWQSSKMNKKLCYHLIPSWHSKPVWLTFFNGTLNIIFWRMLVSTTYKTSNFVYNRRKSYRFGTTWRWRNDNIIGFIILGWNRPLNRICVTVKMSWKEFKMTSYHHYRFSLTKLLYE